MLKIFLRIVAVLVFLAAARVVEAQNLVQSLGEHGTVDWEKQVIRSSGIGSIDSKGPSGPERVRALENAKESALQNLLNSAKLLPLHSSANVEDVLMQDSQTPANFQKVVEAFTIVDTRSMSDMSLEVEIELPITGSLSDLFLPKDTGKATLRLSNELLCPTCGQPWPEGKQVPEGVKLVNLAEGLTAPNGAPYSGLIIDASGLGVKPAVMPRILDEHGHEIFSADFVNRETAVDSGMVTYKTTLKSAVNSERVGRNPLVIRGTKVSGSLQCDVVVSDYDAALIHSAAHTDNFLKKCKVIFVI